MLERVLIANRSEIAIRIMRACEELGVATVAVYSDADENAPHRHRADQSVYIGKSPSSESYLVQERIIQAALATGCDAIHPGYGFLSENADFAQAVIDAGMKFVGPSPDAMRRMGDKVSARAEAERAGVPTAPGTDTLADWHAAAKAAEEIGYPVMLKAVAGGGGMGMRVVHSANEMQESFEGCQAQAAGAFGVPDVFMEKFISRPRHIEIQILADAHGHAIHLYERECSIQRRHQKLLEEAPSPALTQAQREDIGARAVALAQQVGYANAGTMEFLYEDGQFYFNEMNTRLQVEHPVTEMVTGIDLVAWQLRIAAGETLTLQQKDVQLRGHAFEARINAEDPANNFMPSPGLVRGLTFPTGPGVRIDTGLGIGWKVPAVYDSMILKLLIHGDNRDHAARRMRRALGELHIDGFATNAPFHEALFVHPTFLAGDLSTRFLEEHDLMGQLAEESLGQRRNVAAIVHALTQLPGGLAARYVPSNLPPVLQAVPGHRERDE